MDNFDKDPNEIKSDELGSASESQNESGASADSGASETSSPFQADEFKIQPSDAPSEMRSEFFDPFAPEPKRNSWIFSKEPKPEKGYNPYREDMSVFKDIYEKNPKAYRGAEPLEGETEMYYRARRQMEYSYTNNVARGMLKNAGGFISLLALLFILLAYGIQIPVLIGLSGYTPTMSPEQSEKLIDILNYAIMTLQYVAFFPLIFFVGTVGYKNKIRTYFQKPQVSGMFIFRWSIICLGATYIVSIIFDNLFEILKSMGMYVADLSQPLPTEPLDLALYGLFTVIGAPIFEEIMFRGIMLTHLKKYGCIFASVVTGILFGLIHQNHGQMFFAAALGILFGIIALRAGSIIPTIIMHFVVNGFSFLNTIILSRTNYNDVYYYGTADTLDGPTWALFTSGALNALLYPIMAAALILFIVEFVLYPQTFKLPKGDSTLLAGQKAKAYLSSPVTVITLIILALVICTNSFIPVDAILESIMSALESANQLPV